MRQPRPQDDALRISSTFNLSSAGRPVPLDRGVAVPRRFTTEFHFTDERTVTLDVVVEDGTPRIFSVSIVGNIAERVWVSPSDRLPLARLLDLALVDVAMRVDPSGATGTFRLSPAGEDDTEHVERAARKRRRRVIDDAFLRSVATAFKVGGYDEVMEAEGPASDSQVYRWVTAARTAGFLPEQNQ